MKIKQRIKKDALYYAEGWGNGNDVISYISGAQRERNKVIDEALQQKFGMMNHLGEVIMVVRVDELEALKLNESIKK